jgi:uncharacterized protein
MFVWDPAKDRANQAKHGVSFDEASAAFGDPRRVIAKDVVHSTEIEIRYFCFGRTVEGILTVRFTWREGKVRIIGAGYWREGRKRYEEVNP